MAIDIPDYSLFTMSNNLKASIATRQYIGDFTSYIQDVDTITSK